MELTIESAFSPGGMVGNASYILLILSMAMRRMFLLRVLAILSGLAGIAYDVIWLHDPVGTFWESCFTATNLVQWLLLVREDRKLRLNKQEKGLWQKFFPELSSSECKQLFLASKLISGHVGDRLITHGKPVEHIYVLLSGSVEIKLDGVKVSQCGPGDLLGEMSFLTGDAATADSELATDAKFLQVDQEHLATLIKSSAELGYSITKLISRNLVTKLSKQTQRDALQPV
ncbi:MAG: Crp/Fnr family transcriptional regulator [bacterium]